MKRAGRPEEVAELVAFLASGPGRLYHRPDHICKRRDCVRRLPMPRHAPRTKLATHEVTNQPPEFVGNNLYTADQALREAVRREGRAGLMER